MNQTGGTLTIRVQKMDDKITRIEKELRNKEIALDLAISRVNILIGHLQDKFTPDERRKLQKLFILEVKS